jgi:hypothetical protein
VADDIEISLSMLRFHNLWFASTIDCSIGAVPQPATSLTPYAPHIAEELWSLLGNEGSIATVPFLFSN